MYKYLFGPVPSRRLGMSLGVDLVTHKICSLNCIYCECGATTDLTIKRKEYVPVKGVKKELENYFINCPDPDYITFSGSGEPCLNSGIGEVIDFIKEKKPGVSIAVLTNGTLLGQEKVRKELLKADLVMPSLDAAEELSFKKINRPFHGINLKDYIQGIADFRKEYQGRLALEILIIPKINDNMENLLLLKKAIEKIKPYQVQLNTLDRPGAVSGIKACSMEEMEKIKNILGTENIEIIASAPKRKNVKSYRKDIESAISETIYRRPCTCEDLSKILGIHITEINKYLAALEDDNKIESVREKRGIFYQKKIFVPK